MSKWIFSRRREASSTQRDPQDQTFDEEGQNVEGVRQPLHRALDAAQADELRPDLDVAGAQRLCRYKTFS